MPKARFSIAHQDNELLALVQATDQKTLAVWAIDCAERVLPFFEQQFPDDLRPQQAIETLQAWLATGVFKMAVIRKASLDAHAAAREVGADTPARSAARAAGQAVATAHVPRHAYGPAIYAQQAIFRAAKPAEAVTAAASERDWQYQRLLQLREKQTMMSRTACEADAPAMGRVGVESYLAAHRDQMPAVVWEKRAREWTPELSAQNWVRTLREIAADDDPRECIYVAVDEAGEIVGLAMGGRRMPRSCRRPA